MSVEYTLKTQTIDVPKDTGVEGFLHALREILKLRRVQRVVISSTGTVTYERFVAEGEAEPSKVNFDSLEPWHVIRNVSEVEEVQLGDEDPYRTVVALFDKASQDKFHPTSFVTGANTMLDHWFGAYSYYGGRIASANMLCGLPVLRDRQMPDTALVMCAGYSRDGALIDTKKAYKIEMSVPYPQTTVEVL